ncbi:hypothetical protein ABAC402_01320 [Asticcacaulis sp. AC402]|nr:hypothetical protein ABAC402_01320 [Asticcacaulis sp. AC402]
MTATAALGVAGSLPAVAAARTPDTPIVWLDGDAPGFNEGMTFGIPWPLGAVKASTQFALGDVPVQSWPIAYWPDGSLKWSAHATAAGAASAANYRLKPGTPAAPAASVKVTQTTDSIAITCGDRQWTVPTRGEVLISGATVAGRQVMGAVSLTVLTQDTPGLDDSDAVKQTRHRGVVTRATIEQAGPVRVVIKLDGHHSDGARQWLPFSVRLYAHAGAESLRIVHSFIWDGDETTDFIRGIGLTASVPMRDELYDRHVRFTGQEGGVWGEAVRPLTGLRRDTGKVNREAQVAGRAIPDLAGMNANVRANLVHIPAWGDFTLSQSTADGYSIKKRTLPGHGWIDVISSHRASGLVYAGGATGGVTLGLKDFWQRAATRLDVRNAASEEAAVTAWLWSPDGPAMDMRTYRPVWGMETFEAQNKGLDITYEDYEPGWDRAYGAARTSELMLWALAATPERPRLAQMAVATATPPRLTTTPVRLHQAGVFGEWSLPDTSTPIRAAIENRFTYQLDYYLSQIEQHRWYGFWNYGDVMHTYDADRHAWRYDIGGFAWDNSELSTDMMLWYGYLRSGRADVFRMAEAMTRQTGEADVYHLGPWKGFGTRHGVQFFSDSSKQPRVSQAAYRRFFYYLTADERTGDLMRDLVNSENSLQNVYIERKVRAGGTGQARERVPGTVDCAFGTSWGSFIAAWFTEWERTADTKWRDRIVNGMNTIATMKYGWFAGGAPFDLKTGKFLGAGDKVSISHLNGVFGVYEMHMELLPLLDVPAYKKVWLDYCKYYNAPETEIEAFLGEKPRGRNLREGHSRLTAYAARELKDEALAKRAWEELLGGDNPRWRTNLKPQTTRIAGSDVLHPLDEDPAISTNGAAQWGLAATANLALIPQALDAEGAGYL